MIFKRISSCFIWMLLALSGCDYDKEARERHYDPLFKHKIDIKECLPDSLKNDFRIGSVDIIDGMLVGETSFGDYDYEERYFFIIDLKYPDKIKVIPNPFKQLHGMMDQISYADGKIFGTEQNV